MKGVGYISRAILGSDGIVIQVNGISYDILPPTIEIIAGVGEALSEVRLGDDIASVVMGVCKMRPYAKALARMISREVEDELMNGTPEEIIDGLERGMSLISTDEWERCINFDVEKNDSKSETAGNATLLGQIASFMDMLHLSYNEVVREIPYRNLVIMQKDKLHTVVGTKVKKTTGKEMAARRAKRQ